MDQKAINVIKNLALDMLQSSGKGHPGVIMSAAPIMYTLFTKNLKVNTAVLDWVNRDRFILSAGHASELLYSTMFLCGYPLMIEDLKDYRKLNSKTPGHPSLITPGVEIATGYSGEGLANGVGYALAEKIYEDRFNYVSKGMFDKIKVGKLIDYYTYVFVSDGDLMEGVSYEAASFAGTNHLGKLIVLYDSNNISADGEINKTFSESVLARFSALGWDTHNVKNGNSVNEIDNAIKKAKRVLDKPSIIKINTILGEGLSNQGTNIVHAKMITKEDLTAFKEKTGYGSIPFTLLKEPASYMRDQVVNRGISEYDRWKATYEDYKKILTREKLEELENISFNNVSIDLTKIDIPIDYENKELLRDSNHRVMNVIGQLLPNFIGGSADLAYSTRVSLDTIEPKKMDSFDGKNISFGVRNI